MQNIAIETFSTKPFRILDRDWALLVSGTETPNPMTVSWGGFGTLWNLPIVTVYVRPTRHTYGLLEATRELTLNFLSESKRGALDLCGSASGRSTDKWAAAGLTKAPSSHVKVPRVEGAKLVFECRVVGAADVRPDHIYDNSLLELYRTSDYHRIYFGHVLGIYAANS